MSAPVNRSYVILGAAMLVALFGLLWLAGNIDTLRRQDGQRYTVALVDGSGLPLGSPVRLAGVDVGTIESVEVVDGQAVFTLVLDPAVELRADAAAGPRAKSLLGQKFIELRPGSEGAPRLAEGGEIPNSWDAYDVDEALNALEPIFGSEGSLVSNLDEVRGLFSFGSDAEDEADEAEPKPEPKDSAAQVEELSEQVAELREAAADARELSTKARDELPGLLADANATLTGRELDRTLTRLDRLAARTADDLPKLFETGEKALRDIDGRLDELDELTRGVTPERVAELDEVLDELASASAEARTTTSDFQGVGEDVGPLIDTLELLARRAASIDELTIRKFLQEEGFVARFGGGKRKQALERLELLEDEDEAEDEDE